MIKKLFAFDFDKTIMQTPEPEEGKEIWKEKTGNEYPHIGWWSKPESLDLNVFSIKPFPSILNILKKEMNNPNSYVIVLTSRLEKLRPSVYSVLDANWIDVHKLDMSNDDRTKGDKILEYIDEFSDLEEINVYDDREKEILIYQGIRDYIPKNIKYNIYFVVDGQMNLVENNRLTKLIHDEIKKIK